MTEINAISPIAVADVRYVRLRGISPQTDQVFSETASNALPESSRILAAGLAERIPRSAAREISGILRSVRGIAGEAAELGQAFTVREQLQLRVAEQLSDLDSFFQTLPQETLDLITAVFQNRFQSGLIDTGQDAPGSDSDFFGGLISSPIEIFSGIDVSTEAGVLSALGLSDTALELLNPANANAILTNDALLTIYAVSPLFGLAGYLPRELFDPVE